MTLAACTDDGGCRLWQPVQADSQPKSSGLVLGRRLLGAVLHSSNEPGELSQWLCRDDSDDSTINIVLPTNNFFCYIRRFISIFILYCIVLLLNEIATHTICRVTVQSVSTRVWLCSQLRTLKRWWKHWKPQIHEAKASSKFSRNSLNKVRDETKLIQPQ